MNHWAYAKCSYFKARRNRINRAKKAERVEAFILEKVYDIRKEMPKLGGKKLHYLINKEPARRKDVK